MYVMKFRRHKTISLFSLLLFAATISILLVAAPSQTVADDSSTRLVKVGNDDDRQSPQDEVSEPGKLPETTTASTNKSPGISTLMIVPANNAPQNDPDPKPVNQSKEETVPTEKPVEKTESVVSRQQLENKPAARSIEPIPESEISGPPSIEAASFKGVTPGQTTAKELEDSWGAPLELRSMGSHKIMLFSVGPFKQIEVAVNGNIVASIVIKLEKPFPAGAVVKQLQLSNVRPVFISNELGDVLGQAFPERGVMFAFVQNHEPGRPSMQVDKIVLEPIDPEAFILRAETNIDSHYERTLADLDVAIKLAPQNAKAQWLRSRVLTAMEKIDKSIVAAEKAVQFDPDNPQYRITLARILAQDGKLDKAIAHADVAIKNSNHRPHIKAAAQCLLGDLLSTGEKPNFTAAIKYHMSAIKTADPLSVDRHPAIRLAAKEVLIDAHLGAANDIAWGGWSQKDKAVLKWTQRAAAFAEELIANDGGGEEHRFRVATRTLAAVVGVKGGIDPKSYAEEAKRVGDEMINLCNDPLQKRQLQSDLGMALFNAMQIAQARKDNASALDYGQKSTKYLEAAIEQGIDNPTSVYLLGRLYFRMGAIHALQKKDHKAAIPFFNKSVALLSQPFPDELKAELGRHGETFVSMAVSYWATDEKQKALELTKVGLVLMKEAVEAGLLKKSSLAVPYQNLAAMQRNLGDGKAAEEYERLAKSVASKQPVKNTTARKDAKKTVKR